MVSDTTDEKHAKGRRFCRAYKTQICTAYAQNSICKYGAMCCFAHGPEELRQRPNPPKYKTTMCRNIARFGYCPYGDKCDFIHDKENICPQININQLEIQRITGQHQSIDFVKATSLDENSKHGVAMRDNENNMICCLPFDKKISELNTNAAWTSQASHSLLYTPTLYNDSNRMIPASLTDTLSLSEPISLAYDRFDSIFDLSATPEAYSLNTQEYNPFCKDYYTNSMLPNAITEKTRGNGALEFNHTFHSANDLQQHPSRQFVSDLRQQQQPSLFARTSPLFHTRGSNYTPSHIARESGFYGVLAAIDNSGLKIN